MSLIETKPIVCLPWEILHYKISREKLEPEPGFEPRTSGFQGKQTMGLVSINNLI